ncbi:MAG: RNA polymerase sigma factor [Polyangiaceae bacterium]
MTPARRTLIHAAMVRLADGDRSAFDVLLDELWPVILSFAERGVGRGADAEDIAQEVFYKVCARISDFDTSRDGLAWVFGITSYEILTHRRRVQRRREVYDEGSLDFQVDQSGSQEDRLLSAEMAHAFQAAVGCLTEQDRVSLGLDLAGFGGEGAPSGATQRKRKQRALERLRGLWRRMYGES